MNSFNFNSKNYFIKIFFFIISINYIFFLWRFFERNNGYILGDWLINYEGGFVRRGFLGYFITNISFYLNINIVLLTYFIVLIIYILFTFFFFRLIRKKKLSFGILILIFSPATFLFNFYDPLAIGRKEILFFLFFLIYLEFNKSELLLKIYPLLAFFITLTHELFFFITPFFFIYRFIKTNSFDFLFYKNETYIFVFSSIALLLIFFFSNPDVKTQCNYLLSLGLDENVCWSVMDTKKKNIIISNYYYKKFYLYYWLFFLIIILSIFYNLHKLHYLKFNIILYIFITFLFLIPIFLIVNDWGRYLNIYAMLWMILIVHLNNQNNYLLFEKIKFFNYIFIFLFCTSWYMPSCCPERHFSVKKYNPGIVYLYNRLIYRLNNLRYP